MAMAGKGRGRGGSCGGAGATASPNPNSIHGVVNPLPSSAVSGLLKPQAAGQYPHDPYASQQPAALDCYYQQLYAANPLAYAPAPAPVRAGNTIVDLETKKRNIIEGGTRADAVRVCTICNVVCNSDKVFVSHLAGKNHALKVQGAVLNVAKPKVPTYVKEPPIAKMAAKKASQGLVTSSYCDVCKINCNSVEDLKNHKFGKKHLKNVQKLQQIFVGPKPPNPKAAATTKNSAQNERQKQQKQNTAAKPKEDLELKKLKVLSRGGAATAEVEVHTFSNVACTSKMVYRYHISGKKHIATMKQHGASVS